MDKRFSFPLFTLMYMAAILFAKAEVIWWVLAGTLILDFFLTTPLYSAHEHEHSESDSDVSNEAAEELKKRKEDERLVS